MTENKDKKIFIGVDEAGYGPNLGPLLIAASAWEAPASFTETEIIDCFAKFSGGKAWSQNCSHVPLADSKKLYQPSTGLLSLEAGLLSMLGLLGRKPQCLQTLLKSSCHSESGIASDMPWFANLDQIILPKGAIEWAELQRLGDSARRVLDEYQIRLLDIRAAVVSESEFNSGVAQLDSKGLLLSRKTLQLVVSMLEDVSQPAEVFCDRQGGRKNYMPILIDAFPDQWFTELSSTNVRCSYRNQEQPSIDIHFSVGGDNFPPTALASMLAKYLRECLMGAFNSFWQSHLPEIKPTAGYPVDAKRFRNQIESKAEALGLANQDWWRSR